MEVFGLFVRTGSLEATLAEMAVRGWRQKVWRTRQGTRKGGREFDRGALVRLLRNVVYRGQVQYEGKLYPGEQVALVEKEVWHQAQAALRRQPAMRRVARKRNVRSTDAITAPSLSEKIVRVPRISRLMALGVRLEGLVRQGQVKDYAELARLGGISRARVTQILNLRNLSPAIQERLLFLEGEAGGLHERALRRVAQRVDWEEQQRQFEGCSPHASRQHHKQTWDEKQRREKHRAGHVALARAPDRDPVQGQERPTEDQEPPCGSDVEDHAFESTCSIKPRRFLN